MINEGEQPYLALLEKDGKTTALPVEPAEVIEYPTHNNDGSERETHLIATPKRGLQTPQHVLSGKLNHAKLLELREDDEQAKFF